MAGGVPGNFIAQTVVFIGFIMGWYSLNCRKWYNLNCR